MKKIILTATIFTLVIFTTSILNSCSICGMRDGLIQNEAIVHQVELAGKENNIYKVTIEIPTQHYFYTDSLYSVGDTIKLFYYKKK